VIIRYVCVCTRSAHFIEGKYRHVEDLLDTSSDTDDSSMKVWTSCCFIFISPYSVAFGVILSLLFVCLFVWLRISQRRMVRSA